MGLQFTVGNPSVVFVDEFAELVRSRLADAFGDAVVLDSPQPPYRSDECGWSGWSLLQGRAVEAVGAEQVPQLLAMEAWTGCYVPVVMKPAVFVFPGESTRLDVASLPALLSELYVVGCALGMPYDDESLESLVRECIEDDEMDTQTYAALLLAARVAEVRRQPLWVVK